MIVFMDLIRPKLGAFTKYKIHTNCSSNLIGSQKCINPQTLSVWIITLKANPEDTMDADERLLHVLWVDEYAFIAR